MGWTISHNINTGTTAAADALAKFRKIADSARGDGVIRLTIDPDLSDTFRTDVTPGDRTVSVAAQNSIALLYAAYDFENKYIPLAKNRDLWNNDVTIGDHLPEWHSTPRRHTQSAVCGPGATSSATTADTSTGWSR